MSTLQNSNASEADYPWIVFRMGENQYALSSQRVSSITQLTDDVTAMPDAPAYVRGLFSLRGSTVPLFGLREILGMETLLEEYQEFADMLEQRKQDHLHWAEELRYSVENQSDFALTTDPHKCKFGQWYDHYHDSRSSVNFQLKKIDEPHKKLHHAAVLANDATLLADCTERDALLHRIIDEVETQYIPEIVRLLDETMTVFKSSIREMVLVFGEGERLIGYIVDEVIAVQNLEPVGETEALDGFSDMQYVVGISQNEQGLILKLDESKLEGKITCC